MVTEQRGDNSWMLFLIVAFMLCLILLALPFDNVAPPVGVSEHALAKHGADAQRAYDAWQGGCYTQIWRNVQKNRVAYIVLDGAAVRCIFCTTSGLPITSFCSRLTMDELMRKLENEVGWEYVGEDQICR